MKTYLVCFNVCRESYLLLWKAYYVENLHSARKNWSRVWDLLSFCSPVVSSTLSCSQGLKTGQNLLLLIILCPFFCLVLFLESIEEVFKQPNWSFELSLLSPYKQNKGPEWPRSHWYSPPQPAPDTCKAPTKFLDSVLNTSKCPLFLKTFEMVSWQLCLCLVFMRQGNKPRLILKDRYGLK